MTFCPMLSLGQQLPHSSCSPSALYISSTNHETHLPRQPPTQRQARKTIFPRSSFNVAAVPSAARRTGDGPSSDSRQSSSAKDSRLLSHAGVLQMHVDSTAATVLMLKGRGSPASGRDEASSRELFTATLICCSPHQGAQRFYRFLWFVALGKQHVFVRRL